MPRRKKPTSQEKVKELVALTNEQAKRQGINSNFELLLGFGLETGGRRYRELVIQPALNPEHPQEVILNINDALLTLEQARIIQRVLHLSTIKQQSVLFVLFPHDPE